MPAVTASGSSTATPSPAALKAASAGAPAVVSLFVSDKAARHSASESVASLAQNDGPSAIKSTGFIDAVVKALNDKKSPGAREGAADAVTAVSKVAAQALEPFFIDFRSIYPLSRRGILPIKCLLCAVPPSRQSAVL